MSKFFNQNLSHLLIDIVVAVPTIMSISNVIVIRRRRREVDFGLTA